MRGSSFGRCAVLLLLAASGAAYGAEPEEGPAEDEAETGRAPSKIEAAENAYKNLDFATANRTAQRILEQRGLTHDKLVRAYRVLAQSEAVLGRSRDAREAFFQLLMYDPDFKIDPDLSPKVTAPFEAAKQAWQGEASRPGIEVVATLHGSDAATLRVTTHDPKHVVDQVIAGYHWGARGPYTTKPASLGAAVSVETSPPPDGETRLDYYVQALDEQRNVVFEAGTPGVPRTVTTGGDAPPAASDSKGRSVFASPIFWGVVVGLLAGGGVATYVLLHKNGSRTAHLMSSINCGSTDPTCE